MYALAFIILNFFKNNALKKNGYLLCFGVGYNINIETASGPNLLCTGKI